MLGIIHLWILKDFKCSQVWQTRHADENAVVSRVITMIDVIDILRGTLSVFKVN